MKTLPVVSVGFAVLAPPSPLRRRAGGGGKIELPNNAKRPGKLLFNFLGLFLCNRLFCICAKLSAR
jgi:hypothetical protein